MPSAGKPRPYTGGERDVRTPSPDADNAYRTDADRVARQYADALDTPDERGHNEAARALVRVARRCSHADVPPELPAAQRELEGGKPEASDLDRHPGGKTPVGGRKADRHAGFHKVRIN